MGYNINWTTGHGGGVGRRSTSMDQFTLSSEPSHLPGVRLSFVDEQKCAHHTYFEELPLTVGEPRTSEGAVKD